MDPGAFPVRGRGDPEEPVDPEEPENPEDPEDPEDPEYPERPENPEDPENPENPEDPEGPENQFQGKRVGRETFKISACMSHFPPQEENQYDTVYGESDDPGDGVGHIEPE